MMQVCFRSFFNIFLFLIILFVAPPGKTEGSISFQETKSIARKIWSFHRETVYCGCRFDKHLKVDTQSCGYFPQNVQRGERVEWEHIVPVSWFGHQRLCWREKTCVNKKGQKTKGRQCCEKVDPEFRKMYTDLHNLIPVIGEVNAARRNYRFVEAQIDHANYNGCKIAIDNDRRSVSPRESTKGLIARAHLYMSENYNFKLSAQQHKLFSHWDQRYPPSEWEIMWNALIQAEQGTDNLYISHYGRVHDR